MAGDGTSFEWPKYYKAEENLIQQAFDIVAQTVSEFYGIDDLIDLTPEQIEELEAFRAALGEYSPLQFGFGDLIGWWESENFRTHEHEDL